LWPAGWRYTLAGMGEQPQPLTDRTAAGASVTSLSLLERVRANDAEAWRRLVHVYSPLVYHWGKKAGLTGEDAADLLQEVFGAVAAGLGGFRRPGGSFRGWLWGITRNKLADHYRRRAGRPEAAGGSDAHARLREVPEQEPADDDVAGDQVVRRALELLRGDFEDHTWQAFWRTTVEEQDAARVAADLGMTVNGVYQAKSRVLRRLREELRELVD
jgi:RNA polymerase sigma-70 factor (ECF subfamily)